jgi:hypothetical protein
MICAYANSYCTSSRPLKFQSVYPLLVLQRTGKKAFITCNEFGSSVALCAEWFHIGLQNSSCNVEEDTFNL